MITANTKITALEILNECGIANAEALFGTVRIRVGGIPGVNRPDQIINLQPEVEKVDVIVGDKLYELTLAAGTPENNKTVHTISEGAQAAFKARGEVASEKAAEIQAVKELAKKMREDENYKPTKAEEKHVEKANEKIELDEIAIAAAHDATRVAKKPIKVVSK